MITKKEKEELTKVTQSAFGHPLDKHVDLHGTDVYLRTLFDGEIKEAMRRGMMAPSPPEQLFEIERWKLTHSLLAVGGTELQGSLEEKREVIDAWLTVYVNMLIKTFEDLEYEELALVDTLKKFTGTAEPPNTEI